MDLSHFAFLHSKWNLARPEHMSSPTKIIEDGDSIIQREMVDVDMPSVLAAAGMKAPFSRNCNHLVRMPGMHEGWQVTRRSFRQSTRRLP